MAQMTALLTVFTAPFHAISTSMQLSVLPHLTAYGDVKESEVNKGVVRSKLEGVGLLEARAKEASSKELAKEVKYDLLKPAEVRADLMQASG